MGVEVQSKTCICRIEILNLYASNSINHFLKKNTNKNKPSSCILSILHY